MPTEPDVHRAQGVEANNSIWELLGKADRTESEDEEMIRRAYAAAYHWDRAISRGPENAVRADYMIAKVQLAVGQPEIALSAARRCLGGATKHALADFDLAYAHEVTARALHALGNKAEAAEEWSKATAVEIADEEDRKLVEQDFADFDPEA